MSEKPQVVITEHEEGGRKWRRFTSAEEIYLDEFEDGSLRLTSHGQSIHFAPSQVSDVQKALALAGVYFNRKNN